MEAMRTSVEQSTKKIQEQLKKTFEMEAGVGTYQPPIKIINYAMRLQKLVMKNQKLEESILKTQEIMDKIQHGVAVTVGDIEQLRGSINRWHEEKEQSNQEEQNGLEAQTKVEEERKRNDEKVKKKEKELKTKEDKRKREEEDRQKKEEEKRLKKEEELKTKEAKRKREEEERQKKEEEKRRKKEDKRKAKEDEDRRKKEEEEKRKQEEEERINRVEQERHRQKKERKQKEDEERMKEEEEKRNRMEQEDRLKNEEEERRRREEEERQRKEEEMKLKEEEERKRNEDERNRKEAEERKMKEEEGKRKRDEENRQRKEDERKERLEAERKRREEENRRKIEAKEREENERRRKDPANWIPYTYRRLDGESDAFHRGICCQVSAMDGELQEEDLECLASDEYTEEAGQTLEVGDKLASSLIQVHIKKKEKELKFPVRVYIPLCSVSDSSDEIIVKASLDNDKWIDRRPASIPSAQASQSGMTYTGIDVSNFHTVKLLAVAKSRSEELLVDEDGISQASIIDKNIKLFVPRDAFSKPTKMSIKIQQIKENILAFAVQYYENCRNVLSTSSVMTITCETPTEKDIELDLTRIATKDKRMSDKGRYLHMYKCRGENWKIADSEIKGRTMDVSITLPSRKDNYKVLEIEGRRGIPNEEFLKAADELFFHSNASIVRIVAKQKAENPHIIMIQCVRNDQVSLRVSEMERRGYSLGPDTSKEFALIDGQNIIVWCSGNIAMTAESEVKLSFHAYMDTAKQEIYLEVLDEYKQKNQDVYHGHLHFEVLKDNREGTICTNTKGSLPITLPKSVMKRPQTVRASIRLPYYLISLAKFLAMNLTAQSNDDTWLQVIYRLGSHDDMDKIRRRAIARCDTSNNSLQICEIMLHDWMKSKPVQEDKIKPIIKALRGCQRITLSNECEKFVHIHMKYLSDTCISEMATKTNDDWTTLAINLGLSNEDITACKSGSKGSNEAATFMMLCKWRVSDAVITSGLEVFNDLLGKLETTQKKDNGLTEYISHVMKQINKE